MGIETALIAAAAVAAVSSVASGYMALKQGNAANKAATQAAIQAEKNGQEQAAATRRKGNIFLGTQRAQFGAMGFDPLGNALDVLQSTAFENELEAQSYISRSKFEAYQYKMQGKAAKSQGVSSFIGGMGQAASSILVGAKGMGGGGSTNGGLTTMGGINQSAGNTYSSGYSMVA